MRYNGGQTPTHNLLKGSPAIGAGGTTPPDECPGIDQNGIGRIASSCDIGSTTYVPKPKLKVVRILPKKKAIKRGKKRIFTIVIRNLGDGPAVKTRVCLALPKATRKGLKIKGKACRTPGKVGAGKTRRVKIRLAAKPGAKKKAYKVKATVRARSLKPKSKTFKVRVR